MKVKKLIFKVWVCFLCMPYGVYANDTMRHTYNQIKNMLPFEQVFTTDKYLFVKVSVKKSNHRNINDGKAGLKVKGVLVQHLTTKPYIDRIQWSDDFDLPLKQELLRLYIKYKGITLRKVTPIDDYTIQKKYVKIMAIDKDIYIKSLPLYEDIMDYITIYLKQTIVQKNNRV